MSESLALLYETVIPGVGFKKYRVIFIYLSLELLCLFFFIYPHINIIATYAALLSSLLLFYGNIIYRYRKIGGGEALHNTQERKLFFNLIFPGLFYLLSDKKIKGILIGGFYLFLINNLPLVGTLYKILYLLVTSHAIKGPIICFSLYSLLMLPIESLVEAKYENVMIASASMSPTLNTGERYLVKVTDEIRVGDIGTFQPSDFYPKKFTKRVVGLEGDRLLISSKKLYVNGKMVDGVEYQALGYLKEDSEVVVGQGEVYILGDNTEDSYDSKEYGPLKKEFLYGKVLKKITLGDRMRDTWKLTP